MSAEYYIDALLDRMSLADLLKVIAHSCELQAHSLNAWEDDIGASRWSQAADTIAHVATFETIKEVST